MCLRVIVCRAFRRRYFFQNRFKERRHIFVFIFHFPFCIAVSGSCVQNRKIKLLFVCIKCDKQVKDFIHHPVRFCCIFVDFVDDYYRNKSKPNRFFQYKFGLRHHPFLCIDKKEYTVNHLQDALNFSTKVRVTRGVDNVDLVVAVGNSSIFGKDCNPSLFLDVIAVHRSLFHFLVGSECSALL